MCGKTVEISSTADLRNLIRQQAGDGKILTITLEEGFKSGEDGEAEHDYESPDICGAGSPRTTDMAVQEAWEGDRADG